MLEAVKLALRLTSDAYDNEILDLIEAAKGDLYLSGIKLAIIENDEDPLIIRAIIQYCKTNFGFNPDAERLQKSYTLLKCHLSLSQDYT